MNVVAEQMLKQQQSVYRQYFSNIEGKPGRMQCMIDGCGAEMASKKSSNLQSHLQNVHKDFYATIPATPPFNQIMVPNLNNDEGTTSLNIKQRASSVASTSSDLLVNEESSNKTTILSERSRHKLIHQNFGYIFDKTSTDQKTNFWRCERKSLGCMARMHTHATTNEFIRLINDHDHPSKAARIMQIESGKPAVVSKQNKVQDEIESSIRRLANSIINKLHNEQTNKRRREFSPATSECTKRLEIPDEYKLFNNEQFLLADSFDWQAKTPHLNGDSHVLIFGRASNRLWATQANRIYLEVLNCNLPEPFTILCVLWSERSATHSGNLQLFPLTYVLLEKEQDFKWMFGALKTLWPQFNPTSVTIDLVNTNSCLLDIVHEHFVESAIHLSFLSMSRLLKQFLIDTDVDGKRLENEECLQNYRLLLALSFIPFNKIHAAFNEVTINLIDSCPEMLKWFEAEFIGKSVHSNHQRRPRIAPEIWFCHSRLMNAEMLSNKNSGLIEKRLCSKFDEGKTPEICEWIEALRQFQYFIDLQTEQFTIGVPLDYHLEPEYNEQMFKIVNGFSEGANLIDFLYEVGQNLRVF